MNQGREGCPQNRGLVNPTLHENNVVASMKHCSILAFCMLESAETGGKGNPPAADS